jgi:hypothetical protein
MSSYINDLSTDPDELQSFILITIKGVGMVRLSELLPAFWAIAPGVAPETIHDAVNNLLVDGRLKLSPVGIYYVPSKAGETWEHPPLKLK